MQKLPGIDTSAVQVISDLDAFKNCGQVFGFVKATEGVLYANPKMQAQVFAMHLAAMLTGLYLFFLPHVDAKAQADFFIAKWKSLKTELPPMIDLEWMLIKNPVTGAIIRPEYWNNYTWQERVNMVHTCIEAIRAGTGRNVIIYTNNAFYSQYINGKGTKVMFGNCRLFLAYYGSGVPVIPVDWTAYDFLQYGTSKTIPGINEVDVDWFNGTLDQLKAL